MEELKAPKTILMVGATSSLAQALCRELAQQGLNFVLAGRDDDELQILADDLAARYGVISKTIALDLLAPDFSAHQLIEEVGIFHAALIACGDMGDENFDDLQNIAQTAWVNYTAPAQIATLAAQRLANIGGGSLVIVGSVAGDRGRASNYPYGSAKAAIAAFASGLRNRYAAQHVHVMTVKPGFIDTPMTWGMKSPLIANREKAAQAIVAAMRARKDIVYVPFFWRYIMLIIRHIPESIFKKMKL